MPRNSTTWCFSEQMASLKIIFRQAKTLLWTAFSILVILAAVVVGVGKLLMPYSDRYQPRLEAWLSQEFGQQVVLESFEGEWAAFGPRLSLQGMQILPNAGDSTETARDTMIESAALDIKPLNALIPGLPLYNFRVIGADFVLQRTGDGQFELSGFGVSQGGTDQQSSALKELARVGDVILQDSSLEYRDEKYGVYLGLTDIQGRLHHGGDEMAMEIQASLFDQRGELIYGEVEATLLVKLDDEQKMTSAAWQSTTREFMLAAFQGKLPSNPFLPLTGWLNAELWGEWSAESGHRIKGVTDVRDAVMVNEYQDLHLERINFRFNWQFAGAGHWNLHLADLLYDDGGDSWTAPRVSIARNTAEDLGLWISADELPLDVPLNLARDVMSIYQTDWPAFLPRLASGQISDLQLILSRDWKLLHATGGIRQASVADWQDRPDLQGIDGELALSEGAGRLHLSGDRVSATWPRMFRDPISVEISGCELDFNWGLEWQVAMKYCSIENEDVAVTGDMVIRGNEGKPGVDVNVAVLRGDIGRLDSYWPESILNDNVKGWLRRGLKSGEIKWGRLQIHGDMDDWPFRNGEGRFEAIAEVDEAHIDYLEDWPAATDLHAVVRFLGAGMDIRGEVGDIGGLAADSVSAGIADMKTPLLKIAFEADSELPLLLDFLEKTPLREQIDVDLSELLFSGPAHTTGSLDLPLGQTPGQLSVDGTVVIDDNRFSDPIRNITLENISGHLKFSERGFSGTGLEAEFHGHEARLDLVADADSEEKFRAGLTGEFGVRDVIPDFLLEDFRSLDQLQGDCPWLVTMTVAPADNAQGNATVLTVESQLEGVALDLPAPMNKKADENWPLSLRYPLSGPDRILDIVFEERSSMRFDLSGENAAATRAAIHLGDELATLPGEGLFRIDGEPGLIDLDGWIDVVVDEIMQGAGMGGLDLEGGSLFANKMIFLDRHFEDVGMQFEMQDSDFLAEFSASNIDGAIRFTTGESGMNSLSAEFERLVLGDPLSTGVGMESNPSDLPALHLYARSFSYAGVELGETRIEAYPTSEGFHFEKVDASSSRLSVQASGDWMLHEDGQRSDFDIHMASESLGDFLESMDISSPVQGGQTLVNFNAWWPGSPAAFGLSSLNGQLDFSVVDGNITEASSGSGRLLGLLSVQALPKRLSLDFRDVFDSGFSFDEATGTFDMRNGTALTEDVLLKSSAASITVTGRTDLVAREYDQLMTIRPGVGNTLPIIGALAAGPGGAAAGLALQGLLHQQLAEATKVRYTITGNWDSPNFEAVEVDQPSSTP